MNKDPRMGKLSSEEAAYLKKFAQDTGMSNSMPAWMKEEIDSKTSKKSDLAESSSDSDKIKELIPICGLWGAEVKNVNSIIEAIKGRMKFHQGLEKDLYAYQTLLKEEIERLKNLLGMVLIQDTPIKKDTDLYCYIQNVLHPEKLNK